MTCTETRDLFSALVDDALTPAERTELDMHLADCPDCRRELAALLRTVKLVRAIDPPRAPSGFVERVMAAARPVPRPTRWRRLAPPWPALPLSAAALLLIGGLAVLLFRASPEQQRAAQHRLEPPPGRATPAPARESPSTPPAPDKADTRETADARAPAPPEQGAEPPRAAAKRAETRAESKQPRADVAAPAEAPQAMGDRQTSAAPSENRAKSEASERAQTSDAATTRPPAAAPPATDAQTPPVGAAATTGAIAAAKSQATPQASPLSRTGPTTGIPAAPPDVTARLRVADVSLAERSLIEAAARVGGRQTGRRIDGGRLVVVLAVPRDAYPDFVRQLTALGPLSIDRQATEHSTLAVVVTVGN